ncbi:MAG: 4-hydroxy-tetrahydrodipicolinate reductase [Clostridia bacterium]
MIKIIICGFSGKMGQTLFDLVNQKKSEFCVVAGVDAMPCESSPIPTYTNFNDIKETADIVIDFSRPEGIYEILPFCRKREICALIGTTGLMEKEREFIDSYAPYIPIFESGNMSLGVNLQLNLVKKAAATLGGDFEAEIIEKHHHLKVDAPSGTALMLGNAIASQFPDERTFVFGRYTKTERRKPNEIGFHSVRGGTLVGEHEVMFIGRDEVFELNHRAYSKQVFAEGALRAAKFLLEKQPGLYNMQDIVLDHDVASNIYINDDQALITINDLPNITAIADIFEAVAKQCIFVDMISLNMPRSLSFTVHQKQAYAALDALSDIKELFHLDVICIENIAKLTVEGVGMELRHGVAAPLFSVLSRVGICPLIVTTSETKIEYGIESEALPKALTAISDYLDL